MEGKKKQETAPEANFGFWTLVADFGLRTPMADFLFWPQVTDFKFWILLNNS